MKIEKVANLVEGIKDPEEMKLNLMLAGVKYDIRQCGKAETVIAFCDEGAFRIGRNGWITCVNHLYSSEGKIQHNIRKTIDKLDISSYDTIEANKI